MARSCWRPLEIGPRPLRLGNVALKMGRMLNRRWLKRGRFSYPTRGAGCVAVLHSLPYATCRATSSATPLHVFQGHVPMA
ncbi:hypothetical protein GT037_008522 [Alternaria burnsii]|uniref:Uncharacterized protein n=1 Tax=Alternaria burnsii TaxID=1187904 RepID=A0A8H7AX62_9PLEO|nr:uncharacterized protein GT037_008522 [Alternaria burnsii]KAF7673199.1 hypothetical protein GT037_008522 [Alternaria burnsii]